ncbi:hypothetical protein [Humisphaera borealis]|uniref:Uncharacterized protein n=1 Tax=Humisphaera borealis TaxID=2807512 RepID=A0A7M2WXD4_9BACT|nr:hypothetical protein [Humisphaera borealis]QOV89170.1 hypothetical protein IPV69_23620 [Humisphaera borealis]
MQFVASAFDTSACVAVMESPAVGATVGAADAVQAAPVNAPSSDGVRHSRAEQSRINGAKSRGPTSDAGKAVASQNAWKHGLRARGQLLPEEDPAEFAAFVASFCDDLGAVGPCQVMLAERVAEMAWKLRRMPIVRSAVLCSRRDKQREAEGGFGGMDDLGDLIYELRKADPNGGIVMLLQRYESQIERSMQSALRELRILQGGTRHRAAPAPAPQRQSEPATCETGEAVAVQGESRVRSEESERDAAATVVADSAVVAGNATVVEPIAANSPTAAATFGPDDLLPADVDSRVRSAEGVRGRVAPVQGDPLGRGRSASRRG